MKRAQAYINVTAAARVAIWPTSNFLAWRWQAADDGEGITRGRE
jgi:hypothetical protein